jgi:vacuolar-type H+-ATPase subunit H
MPAPTPATSIADAINRVLEAEREMAAAIAAAQAEATLTIEAARNRRRAILEHARLRITRLHELARARLARRLDELESDSDHGLTTDQADATRMVAAVARVAQRLTGSETP